MRRFKAVTTLSVFLAVIGVAPRRAQCQASAPSPPDGGVYSASVKDWMRLIPPGTFVPRPPKAPPALPKEITQAFVIPIQGEITPTMFENVKRKITRSKGKGAQIIIFDIDSPGGRSDAMSSIVRLILDDLRGIYTVAYVNPQAFSAAAVISLACNEIVLSPSTAMGAAMPVMLGPGKIVEIPEKERGKFESAARTQIRSSSEQNGWNSALCEAMITITTEIWLVRNKQIGELRIVDARDWRARVRGAPPATQPAAAPVQDTPWQFLATICGPMELVSVTASEAVRLGFAEHIFESVEQLYQHYNIVVAPTVLKDNWSETLVGFLTTPAVTSILLMAGIFFLYMEMNTPGFGVPGGLAIACFAILFGSRFLIGLAQWWEIGLFAVGLLLLAVEVFVIPGFGVAGISGIICCVAGLLAMVIPNAPAELPWPRSDMDWSWFGNGVFALGLGSVLGIVAAAVVGRFLPNIPLANRLVLAAAKAATDAPVSEGSPMTHIRVGYEGTVEAICRPVGKVRFGQELFDAAADGSVIEVGRTVRVVRREGNRLVVEEV